jgi:hypothetical protein
MPVGRFLFAAAAMLLAVSSSFAAELSGVITRGDKPVAGAFVTARDTARAVQHSVRTDRDGRFRLSIPTGYHALTARARGFEPVGAGVTLAAAGATINLTIAKTAGAIAEAPSRAFLGVLPETSEKRRFVVDCMGCHSISAQNLLGVDGQPHDAEAWAEAVNLMLSFAGHDTPFPILPPDRTARATADYLAKYLTAQALNQAARDCKPLPLPDTAYRVTEWDIPHPWDFPHDVMLDAGGNLLVTGMFSGVMYTLNPENGSFTTVEIPIEMANPRALDIDAAGNWWVLCGMPGKIARYRFDASPIFQQRVSQLWASPQGGFQPRDVPGADGHE